MCPRPRKTRPTKKDRDMQNRIDLDLSSRELSDKFAIPHMICADMSSLKDVNDDANDSSNVLNVSTDPDVMADYIVLNEDEDVVSVGIYRLVGVRKYKRVVSAEEVEKNGI